MDNQQGYSVQHMELCSMLFGNLGGRGVGGRMDTGIWIAGFLHCSLEAMTRLLIGITPI